jgi:hypothetical protein
LFSKGDGSLSVLALTETETVEQGSTTSTGGGGVRVLVELSGGDGAPVADFGQQQLQTLEHDSGNPGNTTGEGGEGLLVAAFGGRDATIRAYRSFL